MRVLLIEDDAETAAYLQKALRESGHTAEHEADGQAGERNAGHAQKFGLGPVHRP